MLKEGLFLAVPTFPDGEEGIRQFEAAAEAPRKWCPGEACTPEEIARWREFQLLVGAAVRAYLKMLGPERAALMDKDVLPPLPALNTLQFMRGGAAILAAMDVSEKAALPLLSAIISTLLEAAGTGGYWISVNSATFHFDLHPLHPAASLVEELAAAARERRIYRRCPQCGEPFSFQRETAVYCSPACRVAASRTRKALESEQGEAPE